MQAAASPLYIPNQSTATSDCIYRGGTGWLDRVCVYMCVCMCTHKCTSSIERKERSLNLYGARQKEAPPHTSSMKSAQPPHRERCFPMQKENKAEWEPAESPRQRQHGGREQSGVGEARWTTRGRSTSATLTDDSKQNVVIAFLQRSTNHKSPQKRNGKTIKSVCVRGLGLATVTKATFYQQSEDTSEKGGHVGLVLTGGFHSLG